MPGIDQKYCAIPDWVVYVTTFPGQISGAGCTVKEGTGTGFIVTLPPELVSVHGPGFPVVVTLYVNVLVASPEIVNIPPL